MGDNKTAYPSIEIFININKEVRYEVYKVYVVDGEMYKYLIDIAETFEEGIAMYNDYMWKIEGPKGGTSARATAFA